MKNQFKLGIVAIAISLFSCTEDDLFNEDADSRDEFVGNWLASESSDLLGSRVYEVDINKDSDFGSRINILNFYKLGVTDSVYATVSAIESNTITIPNQIVNNNGIRGTGTLNGNEINLVYYVDDGNDIDTVNTTYTRDVSF